MQEITEGITSGGTHIGQFPQVGTICCQFGLILIKVTDFGRYDACSGETDPYIAGE